MWLDGVGFAPPLEDPDKSRVVGKVGYGVMPRGPNAQASATFGDGIGVTAASKNKEAAYLYCQWAISKLMGAAAAGRRRRAVPQVDPRRSGRPQGVKMPPAWIDAVVESGKISKLGLPVVQPVTEFRDIIGIGLTNLIAGGDPATEMKKATEQFKAGPRTQRKGLTPSGRSTRWEFVMAAIAEPHPARDMGAAPVKGARPVRSFWPFVLPAVLVVGSVIVFPWAFTVWMSLHEWTIGAPAASRACRTTPGSRPTSGSCRPSGTRSSIPPWR